MQGISRISIRSLALGSCAAIALASAASAEDKAHFQIAGGDLKSALAQFARQSSQEVLFSDEVVAGKTTQGFAGDDDSRDALVKVLAGTGLTYNRTPRGTLLVVPEGAGPQGGSAGGGAETNVVQELVVTAQKKSENIQVVPIAISAFTQQDLTTRQVTGGPDLMTQVPNFTFTKTNFSGYSIQIRGIGTQAISATTDPAVAVAFNSTPFLRNHFFEQEFYDLERVEVLRGPQGTLFGRNATAGVVNIISAKPIFEYDSKFSADFGNYSSHRVEGMINLPIVADKVALRLAGAWTKRDGYDTNQLSGNPIDGRDLWSTRVSLRIDPSEHIRTNLVWEHFQENDDRLRSGKQLCETAHAPTEVNGVSVAAAEAPGTGANGVQFPQRYLDQGWLPVPLYSPNAFQVPDGQTLPYYLPFTQLGAPLQGGDFSVFDVYASTTQSHDLRTIESQIDPIYRAKSDTLEFNADFDITPSLTFTSQTGYSRDFLWSAEDYNRFDTRPGAFAYCNPAGDSNCSGLSPNSNGQLTPDPAGGYSYNGNFGIGDPRMGTPCDPATTSASLCQPNGLFCDPQLGCSDRLVAEDLSEEHSQQFSQEFRLASNFSGPFNFSVGANYLRYKTAENYFVFINTITLAAASNNPNGKGSESPWIPGVSDNHQCLPGGFAYVNPFAHHDPQSNTCAYIDPNSLENLNNEGHNYFLSQNPYKLTSYAAFGEAYYNLTSDLKLTAGVRWTVDKKHFVDIPSELFVAGYGYPVTGMIDQRWSEPTGRLVVDWTPKLGFTDQTLVYASYVRGYKAGGANPPGAVLLVNRGGDISNPVHPLTFNPEFVNAYEIGTKNTLLDGKLTFNLNFFYYDYKGYQISEIVDRSAINTNFDAKVWGSELETDWRPLKNLRLGLKIGYENTRLDNGDHAVDLIDRTAGNPDWMIVKRFVTQASNCILPTSVVAALLLEQASGHGGQSVSTACGLAYDSGLDPVTGLSYVANPTQVAPTGGYIPPGYPGFNPATAPNNGQGFDKNLSGKELPNAPHYTATLTVDYTLPLPRDWLVTLHGDFYQQSEAWARVFNMPGYDRLKAYNNVNFAAIFSKEDAGWQVMAYVKNVFNKDNITGAFLNSDDSGLTTNVFLNEPRLYGVRLTKQFDGSSWLGQQWSSHAHTPGAPYPFRIEVEGDYGPFSGDHEALAPDGTAMFSSDFPFPLKPQSALGWGGDGGVKLTYAPDPQGWSFSAAVRYGRAIGSTHLNTRQPLPEVCFTQYSYHICTDPTSGDTFFNGSLYSQGAGGKYNFTDTTARNEETHAMADFMVGREVGMGSWSSRMSSKVSVGLEYAQFRSSSNVTLHGVPDYYFDPVNFLKYPYHKHQFNADMDARREFHGVGPVLAWDGAVRLLGDADKTGRVDLDVGVGGGVLFGKQKTVLRGQENGSYVTGNYVIEYVASSYQKSIDQTRTKSVSVPTLNANLGLSYTVGAVKVSGGWRAQRYYKVIDGGIAARRTYDRDIDGAYFKVSVGFGG